MRKFYSTKRSSKLQMRYAIKCIAQFVALVAISPFYMVMVIFEVFLKSDKPFQACSQFFSLFPGVAGNYLRQQFYCLALNECHNDCCIEFGATFSQRGIEIGRRVYIGAHCTIGLCKIENDVLIGSNVDILSGNKQHGISRLDQPIREQQGELKKIVIAEDCWIGNSSVVSCDIGKKSIVAAGSVVFKDVSSFSIVGGNPAKLIKNRQ